MENHFQCSVRTLLYLGYFYAKQVSVHVWVIFCIFGKVVNESIADVKTSCVECFASVALCEQLRRADNDPAIKSLLKQRPLDPFRESLMKSVRSMHSYVVGEITKADASLDDQWEEYQRRRQNKK